MEAQNRKFQYSDEFYDKDTEKEACHPVFAAKKATTTEEAIAWGDEVTPPYVLIQASTKGYKNIAFSATLGASKKGAAGYTLSYSLDGKSYTTVGDVKLLGGTSRVMTKLFDNVALPEAVQDADLVYLKITFSQTTVAGAALTGTTGGETAINDIMITGVSNAIVPTATPVPTASGIAPTAAPNVIAPAPVKNTKVAIKKIKLNKKKITLKKGKKYQLKVTKSPAKASGKLTWKSSKKKVATVTTKGKVKAKKKGKTTITVKSSNGKKATCKVTVK